MKRTYVALSILLMLALLSSCTLRNPTDPSPKPSQSTLITPGSVATAPPLYSGSKAFGRYAVRQADTLIYANGNVLYKREKDQAMKTICQIPSDRIIEDLFVSDDMLYFTTQLLSPAKDANRILYRVTSNQSESVPFEIARISGPIAAKGKTVYFVKSGKLHGYDTINGQSKQLSEVGNMAQLVQGGYADNHLYYGVYAKKDADGTLFGESKLYRYVLDTQKSTLIGSMNKPLSTEIIRVTDALIYQIKPGEDGKTYSLRVIDSKNGALNQSVSIAKALLDNKLGSETLYWVGPELHMLVMSANNDPSKLTLSCYKLTSGKPEPVWSQSIPTGVVQLMADETAGQIVALLEGYEGVTFRLLAYNAASGTQAQDYSYPKGSMQTMKRLENVAGMLLVYELIGEDFPKATLLYGADSKALGSKLVP